MESFVYTDFQISGLVTGQNTSVYVICVTNKYFIYIHGTMFITNHIVPHKINYAQLYSYTTNMLFLSKTVYIHVTKNLNKYCLPDNIRFLFIYSSYGAIYHFTVRSLIDQSTECLWGMH